MKSETFCSEFPSQNYCEMIGKSTTCRWFIESTWKWIVILQMIYIKSFCLGILKFFHFYFEHFFLFFYYIQRSPMFWTAFWLHWFGAEISVIDIRAPQHRMLRNTWIALAVRTGFFCTELIELGIYFIFDKSKTKPK